MKPGLLAVAHSSEEYGADRCLHAALPELLDRWDVTVAVPAPGPGIAIMEGLGARVVQLPDYTLRRRHLTPAGFGPWSARMASSVRELAKLHRAAPFELVYSNTLAAGIGPLLRRRFRVPHVVHVHECPAEPKWLPRVLLTMADRGGDLVVCNSHYTAGWIAQHRPQLTNRTVVVHNGLDVPDAPERAIADPHAPIRIACVARIHPKKGQPTLFAALAAATAAGRDWHVDLYGDTLPEHEPLRRELLEYAAAHGITDRVHWHGFVGDVAAQYRDADIAVVPSVVPEEFSLVALEAQSQRVPVVATGPGGASEVVADGTTGLIVAPKDAPALQAALARLADDPALRVRMGDAGRQRATSKFSRAAFATGVKTALERLVAPMEQVS